MAHQTSRGIEILANTCLDHDIHILRQTTESRLIPFFLLLVAHVLAGDRRMQVDDLINVVGADDGVFGISIAYLCNHSAKDLERRVTHLLIEALEATHICHRKCHIEVWVVIDPLLSVDHEGIARIDTCLLVDFDIVERSCEVAHANEILYAKTHDKRVIRFLYKVGGMERQAMFLDIQSIVACGHDDRDMTEVQVVAHCLEHFVAIHHWHLDVEQYHINVSSMGGKELHTLLSILCNEKVIIVFKDSFEYFSVYLVILDYQNSRFMHDRFLSYLVLQYAFYCS